MATQVFSGRDLVMLGFKFLASGSLPVIFISLRQAFSVAGVRAKVKTWVQGRSMALVSAFHELDNVLLKNRPVLLENTWIVFYLYGRNLTNIDDINNNFKTKPVSVANKSSQSIKESILYLGGATEFKSSNKGSTSLDCKESILLWKTITLKIRCLLTDRRET